MSSEDAPDTLPMLIEALRLLAAPAEVQKVSLPDWVAVPDEVALTFSDAYDVMHAESLPDQASPVLARIDSRLSEMSAASQSDLWTAAALDAAPEWEELRRLAHTALRSLAIPYQPPQLDRIQFVPSGFGILAWFRNRSSPG